MSDYEVVNVGPLDAWSALSGAAPGKSFVEGDLGSEFIGLSVNSTEPGGTSPFWHRHEKTEELYVFLEGNGQMALDDEVIPVEAGTIVRVAPSVWRAVQGSPGSATPLKWLCVRAGGAQLDELKGDGAIDQDRPYPWA